MLKKNKIIFLLHIPCVVFYKQIEEIFILKYKFNQKLFIQKYLLYLISFIMIRIVINSKF